MAKLPKLNLDDLPDSPDVPEGRHRAKLIAATAKKTKEEKIPMIEWKWKILSGEAKKLTILSWTVLDDNPRNRANLKQLMIAFGRKKTTVENTDDLLQKIVTLAVARRKFTDKKTGEIRENSTVVAIFPGDAPLTESKKKGIEEDEEEGGEAEEEEKEGEEESDEGEGDEEEGEKDEEEEETPKTKKKVAAKAVSKSSKKSKEDEDEDEMPFA